MRLSTRLVFFTAIATGVLHTVSAAPYGSEEPGDPNIEGLSTREHTAVKPLSLYDRSNDDGLMQQVIEWMTDWARGVAGPGPPSGAETSLVHGAAGGGKINEEENKPGKSAESAAPASPTPK